MEPTEPTGEEVVEETVTVSETVVEEVSDDAEVTGGDDLLGAPDRVESDHPGDEVEEQFDQTTPGYDDDAENTEAAPADGIDPSELGGPNDPNYQDLGGEGGE